MPVPTRRILDILSDPQGDAEHTGMIDLSTNEPPYPPPQAVVDAIAANAAHVHRYPQKTSASLTSRLSHYHSIDPLHLVVGSGSVNVLQQLMLAICEPGSTVVYAAPGFQEYHDQPRVAGARGIDVPLASGHQDLAAMLAAIDRDTTRMVVVPNPHNPTGSLLDTNQLESFLDRVPEHVLVVIDEAYLAFSDGESAIQIGQREGWGNLAVLRTFSKGYGLGGARVGYAITDLHVAAAARRCGRPFSVNRFAQAAAIAALDATDQYAALWHTIRRERKRVRDDLINLGFAVPPSHANFLWLPLGKVSPRFQEHCLAHKIILRACPGRGLRVTVSTPEDNDAFLAAARSFPVASFESLLREGTP